VKSLKVLILGVGVQGSVIASELVKDSEVTDMKLADIDLERAKRLAARLKSKKVHTYRVDASNVDDVANVGRGMDVIVIATTYSLKFNINVMEAALKCGANYQDLASDSLAQLELSNRWKEARLTALINTGASPGITNVLAAHVADRLDRVEEIRVRLAGKAVKEPKEYVPTWSPETAWADMASESMVYEDGEYKAVPPFGGEEVYTFPSPIGPQTVYGHEHEEPGTLPHFIGKGVKYVDFKMGGPDFPLAKAIVELGLMNDNPIDVKGAKVAPRDVFLALLPPTLPPEEMESRNKAGLLGESVWCLLVEVIGEKTDEKMTYTLYGVIRQAPDAPLIPITGISAAIFTKMLGKGKIETKGVIAPEALEPEVRQAFLAELARYGIVFTERVEKRLA
jgi:saccharopine dehydrogenase-like NADP-dependent oxidoreductase